MLSPKPTILIALYRILTNALAWCVPMILRHRAKNGKEDLARMGERLGQTTFARPNLDGGKLVWFHGASVGETMIALHVAFKLREQNPQLRFLFTSQTLTSAQLLQRHIHENDIYQFAPIDTIKATKAFVQYWRPDIAIFVEGEIWPNLLVQIREKNIPTALINARMTIKSLKSWLRFIATSEYLFAPFDFITPADELTRKGVLALGANNVGGTGNLKLSAPPPSLDNEIIDSLKQQTGGRMVWLCASSHIGEEEIVLKAQATIASVSKDTLLIIAPRHLKRAENIMLECTKLGLNVKRRSIGQFPDNSTQVYLWDTMGELGNAMAISGLTLVAGSLVGNIGGHNPIEPAQIGSAIVCGPYVHNFSDIYGQLEYDGGAIVLKNLDPNFIALKIAELLGNNLALLDMTQKARFCIARSTGAMDETITRIIQVLEKVK